MPSDSFMCVQQQPRPREAALTQTCQNDMTLFRKKLPREFPFFGVGAQLVELNTAGWPAVSEAHMTERLRQLVALFCKSALHELYLWQPGDRQHLEVHMSVRPPHVPACMRSTPITITQVATMLFAHCPLLQRQQACACSTSRASLSGISRASGRAPPLHTRRSYRYRSCCNRPHI